MNGVDFNKAVRVTLDNRWALPRRAGVYVVRQGDLVLYVGMTKDFRERWYSHKVMVKVRKYGRDCEIEICCFCMSKQEAWMSEKAFINFLHPVLNINQRSHGYGEINL